MLLGQELKFKNKLCNLKLGTFFSALPGLGASALSGRVELTCESSVSLYNLPPKLRFFLETTKKITRNLQLIIK